MTKLHSGNCITFRIYIDLVKRSKGSNGTLDRHGHGHGVTKIITSNISKFMYSLVQVGNDFS